MQIVSCPAHGRCHCTHKADIEKISGSGRFCVKRPFCIGKEGEGYRNTKRHEVRQGLSATAGIECDKNGPMNKRIDHTYGCVSGEQPQHFTTQKFKEPDPDITAVL